MVAALRIHRQYPLCPRHPALPEIRAGAVRGRGRGADAGPHAESRPVRPAGNPDAPLGTGIFVNVAIFLLAVGLAWAPEAVKTDTETPQEKTKSSMGSLIILLVLALAGGGAALYYFKFRKPKADTTGHDDLDEYDFGEDEDADEEPAEIEIHSENGQEDET